MNPSPEKSRFFDLETNNDIATIIQRGSVVHKVTILYFITILLAGLSIDQSIGTQINLFHREETLPYWANVIFVFHPSFCAVIQLFVVLWVFFGKPTQVQLENAVVFLYWLMCFRLVVLGGYGIVYALYNTENPMLIIIPMTFGTYGFIEVFNGYICEGYAALVELKEVLDL